MYTFHLFAFLRPWFDFRIETAAPWPYPCLLPSVRAAHLPLRMLSIMHLWATAPAPCFASTFRTTFRSRHR